MKDSFHSCHPLVNFYYFTSVIGFSMFFLHPVLLSISLIISMLYSIYLNGVKAVRFIIFMMFPTMIIASAINPMFSHAGVTILYYLKNGNPITLESIYYGMAVGSMLITVILWFSCYNVIMTSDKFIYLFGRIIPHLSLILAMVLRFVPKFKVQLNEIIISQTYIGKSPSSGTIFKRLKNALNILSILITWCMENAIETADSMRSRGYGLKGRTAFTIFRFDVRDKLLLSIFAFCSIIILIGTSNRMTEIIFYPSIQIQPFSILQMIVFIAYGLLLSTPLLLNFMEDLRWKY